MYNGLTDLKIKCLPNFIGSMVLSLSGWRYPRGRDWLEDEIRAWRSAGLNAVVSLLTPDEMDDLGLQREGEVCQKNALEFLSLPIIDRSVPAAGLQYS
jgi:hypothetical protein